MSNLENALKLFNQNPIQLLEALNYDIYEKEGINKDNFLEILQVYSHETQEIQSKIYFDQMIKVDFIGMYRDLETFQEHNIINTLSFWLIEYPDQEKYRNRSTLANITRIINQRFEKIPAILFFLSGDYLTISIIHRRKNRFDEDRHVLEKVVMLKDIYLPKPLISHIEILNQLDFKVLLSKKYKVQTHADIHYAWEQTLSSETLNQLFYAKIYEWFEKSQAIVQFVEDETSDEKAVALIRLLTRLLFVWFVKQKHLISNDFFDADYLKTYYFVNFESDSSKESTFYKSILQNLFFAVLNQKIEDRSQFLKYQTSFIDFDLFLKSISTIPFMNGGLFENLDQDNFSELNQQLSVPNYLFFGNQSILFDGLIQIFNQYQFTLSEQISTDYHVSLDPELLGLVFENLLASYNPETKMSARKQSGSFYTPREIVDYMVEESLMSYLASRLEINLKAINNPDIHVGAEADYLKTQLNQLVKHKINLFDSQQTQHLIKAIDDCKIIDPACGSGAFPIAVLNKLVELLTILDPNNEEWKNRQLQRIEEMPDSVLKEKFIEDIENSFKNNELDYGRKLYLIENCIYGTDIQPIAIQISKLRCFLSLIINQKANSDKNHNFGIRPLPNLETKFIACNSLIQLTKPKIINVGDTYSMDLISHEEQDIIHDLLQKIAKTRHRLFSEKDTQSKMKLREQERQFRHDLSNNYESLLNKEFKESLIYLNYLKQIQTAKSKIKKDELINSLDNVEKSYFEKNHRNALLIQNWNPANQNAKADFFDAEYMFGISNGFDIVLGNPPYLRIQGLKAVDLKQTEYYKDNYKSATGSYDLYVLFIERGLELLHDNGILNYICPDKWINASFGKGLRDVIGSNHHLQKLISFKEYQVFNASTYSSLVWISKKSNKNTDYFELDCDLKNNQALKKDYPIKSNLICNQVYIF